jgi:peptidoglycan/LPS O-acetylase OafA/YrhL
VRYLFWLQNFHTPPPAFFGESWSLSVEEWFYFIFPLGLFLFFNTGKFAGKSSQKLLFYTCFFILVAIGLRAANPSTPYKEFNIVVTRLDAIGYGVLFAILDRFSLSSFFKRKGLLCGLYGFALLTAAVVVFLYRKMSGPLYVLYYPMSGVGLSLLLIFMKRLPRRAVPVAVALFFEKLSKISYSLYLNNLLIIYLVMRYVHLQPGLQLLIAIPGMVLFSSLTYYFIEKNIIAARDRHYPALRPGVPAAQKPFACKP